MTFTAFTNFLTDKLDCWDRVARPFNQNVTIRLGHLCTVPLRCTSTAIDSAIGYLSIPFTFLTLGQNREIYKFTKRHLSAERIFLSGNYKALVSFLNPHFLRHATLENKDKKIRNGLVANYARAYFKIAIEELRGANRHFFVRHAVSRMTAVTETCFILVARVVDLVVGILTGTGALILTATVCPFSSLTIQMDTNNLARIAFVSLEILGIPGDIYRGMATMINPWIREKNKLTKE